MGAYAYCRHPGCELPLDKPTLRQALSLEPWACWSGHANEPHDSEKEVIADQFEAAAEQLEALVKRLETVERHLWPEDED